MKGHLAAKGMNISRIGASLLRVCPSGHHARRTNFVNRLKFNPIRYSANYFGHKLHMDQKVSFRVIHIVARDGYSGKIVGFLTLPMKNVESVYRLVSRVRTPIVCLLHYISVRAWCSVRVFIHKAWGW